MNDNDNNKDNNKTYSNIVKLIPIIDDSSKESDK